ncbi:MAG: EAL domain-containing protein [Lachnospiraceae bacterium]|nr:EAL domain-containing protein [Lachnospiraceae bacterium]
MEDPEFVPAVLRTVDEFGADPENIVVELTESILDVDTLVIKQSFELLKSKGIRIALDDFGTGNSSFWMLHNIDVDILKLDQTFIRGLGSSEKKIDFAIVEGVALMCERIGFLTVAEGVETRDIWEMISKFGFKGIQGYLFSRPVEKDAFEEQLDKYGMKLTV